MIQVFKVSFFNAGVVDPVEDLVENLGEDQDVDPDEDQGGPEHLVSYYSKLKKLQHYKGCCLDPP